MSIMKENLKRFFNTARNWWKKGVLQRASRITYDVVWNIVLFVIIICGIGGIFAGGIGLGYFASLVHEEPLRSEASMANDIYNYAETSSIYFANDVYLGDIRSDLYREEVALENISSTLIDAVIATEDEYFPEHNGVVPKAILRAMAQEFLNSSVQTGGSTLTQQLIKNQILTDEVSFDRKAKEILLAMRLENYFSKDEIIEAYLNIIPYGRNSSGRNIAGIQTASKGIFGVEASELTLPQAAYLAGLPQGPSAYTPFTAEGKLKSEEDLQPGINRMRTVLNRMHDMEYITDEELEEAANYDIAGDFIDAVPSSADQYPYITYEVEKRTKAIIQELLMEEDGVTEEELADDEDLQAEYANRVERELRDGGYQIHTTINKEMYDTMEEVAENYSDYGYARTFTATNSEGEEYEVTQPIQTGAIMIENNTGKIISFIGGRGFDDDHQVNFATDTTRSPGSTIKPLLDYAPAMEEGVIQPATPIADYPQSFPNGGPPINNYGGGNYGIVSARTALANSYNIPAVDTYLKIINNDPAANYLEKMGVTSLDPADHVNPSLAIGGIHRGISVEENVNAFSTFGNNGKFADAYMIDKITTADGDVIYEHETEPVEVFSPQTTYLTIDMMRDVINNGTANYLNSQLQNTNVDWAGKTGTSNDYHDAWFVATNPNITFGTWIGYETPAPINHSYHLSYSHRNLKLWAEVINASAQVDPVLVTPETPFERPDGIVEKSYCAVSGMLPSDLCKDVGLVKTDLFDSRYVPTEEDNSLTRGSRLVLKSDDDGSSFSKSNGIMFNPDWLRENGYDDIGDFSMLYPRTERDKWLRIGIPASMSSSSSDDD
ncbi:transglycosylase domain-containing protein [Oceanobacillus sp. CFH 90083]|uniref:transglycosylase domain-containing protein n=1 Tax=Oceanobacillus sp. CFH 90083 TaxID=2592336 RepID=UPI001D153F4D|nr:transglycosylase domain-containing protein [Oceanobacillus sp. CFH 90083]